jgi:acetylornithine aminotransferase
MAFLLAVMTQAKAVGILGPGSHGSTYGGTVLGSRVVYTVIDTIQKENAVENAAKVEATLSSSYVGNFLV